MEQVEEAPPDRPTQRQASRTRGAVRDTPLNRLPLGVQNEDELDDDQRLSQAVESYIGTHMHTNVKELLAAPDPHAHYPIILRCAVRSH